jgi:hypothetical protein
MTLWKYINEIWERVLANSFSGIHKSKIICSAGPIVLKELYLKAGA